MANVNLNKQHSAFLSLTAYAAYLVYFICCAIEIIASFALISSQSLQ